MGYVYLFLLRRWQAETKWRVVYEDVGDLLLLVADRPMRRRDYSPGFSATAAAAAMRDARCAHGIYISWACLFVCSFAVISDQPNSRRKMRDFTERL